MMSTFTAECQLAKTIVHEGLAESKSPASSSLCSNGWPATPSPRPNPNVGASSVYSHITMPSEWLENPESQLRPSQSPQHPPNNLLPSVAWERALCVTLT